MELSSKKRKSLTRWIIGIAAACILIFLAVQNLNVVIQAVSKIISLFMPLIVGTALAMILNVPMRFFETHIKSPKPYMKKLRRPISFLLALIMIFGILVGVIWLIIPELASALTIVVQEIIELINELGSMSEAELSELPFGSLLLSINWDEVLISIQNLLKNQSGTILDTAVGTITALVGGIFDLFISFVFAVYILFGKDKLKKQCKRLIRVWIPKDSGEWLIHAASIANLNFRNFISGQSLEAVILGGLCLIGMLVLQMPYAPMVSALVGVTALIPVVGGFIGVIVGAFMIVTVDPMKAVIFVIFFLVLQQLEGNIIYPRVMGSRVNLPGMWILAAVTLGGGIGGPVGMLLSVPIASTLYLLFKEATERREKRLTAAKTVLPSEQQPKIDIAESANP